jgi:regulator of protease activity HflC (stomatin/prohibitin superfamily)
MYNQPEEENFFLKHKRKVIYGSILLFIGILVLSMGGKVWENVDAGEIVIIQDPIDGDLHVYKTPGTITQGFGKATHYKKSNQLTFDVIMSGKDTVEDNSIPATWNDGGGATLYGSIRYDLPLSDNQLIALHSTFGSQDAIERDLIRTNVQKAVTLTGPLMSSKESYAEKKNDLIFYIEDQASKGVYRTRQINVKETDAITEAEKTVTKVEIIRDTTGLPLRQEVSPIVSSGIRLYNPAIKNMHYSKDVQDQIRTQQQATMQVQTAIANAKRAEQDALTTAKQGEADAAKAKWQQEVVKAEVVTQAEARRDQAKLDLETAELTKQRLIKEGEGEAAKKRAAMVANGALEQKLDAYVSVQRMWADAFSKYTGNITPQFVTGGSSASNGALNFMEIMSAKAAKDLSLDMKTGN